MAPTPSAHRLRRGLPGYLILFAPHAFAPQRQFRPRDPPSPPVFLLISAHFTATPGIPVSPAELKSARIDCWHVVGRCFFCRYRHLRFVPAERGLQPEGRHPPRGVAASGFRPLRNIPHCCLP